MFKIITFMVLTVFGMIFVIQNADHVVVTLLGQDIRIRLIFLLLTFFGIGYLVSYFFALRKEGRFRREIKELKRQQAQMLMAQEEPFARAGLDEETGPGNNAAPGAGQGTGTAGT